MKAERTTLADPADGIAGALIAAVGLLAVANVVSNRVLPSALYVPWNLVVAAALLVVAVLAHRRPSELGWQRWARGLAVGGGVATLLYQAALRIPFGTVLLEELAFRSVLPAIAARRFGVARACLLSSALFGLWHVLPAWNIGDVNPVVNGWFGDGVLGNALAVTGAVVGTAVAGLWLCWLRYWSGSVLASMLAHLATNSLGYVIAWFVTR